MRRLVFISVLLLCCRQLQAHEPEEFWWHPYAIDADYLYQLNVDSVLVVLETMTNPDSIFNARLNIINHHFLQGRAQYSFQLTELLTNDLRLGTIQPRDANMLVIGLDVLRLERILAVNWYDGYHSLNEIMRVRFQMEGDLDHPIKVGLAFLMLRLYAKTIDNFFEILRDEIIDCYHAALELEYWEPLGDLAGWMVLGGAMTTEEYLQLLDRLPPRPRTMALTYYNTILKEKVDPDWSAREMLRLGGSTNYFGLFRGNLTLAHNRLADMNLEEDEIDSVKIFLDNASIAGSMLHDLEIINNLNYEYRNYYTLVGDTLQLQVHEKKLKELDSLFFMPRYLLQYSLSQMVANELKTTTDTLKSVNRQQQWMISGLGFILLLLGVQSYRLFLQRKALHRANEDKAMLYGMIAHDLRTPLSALDGLMEQDVIPATIRQPFTTYSRRLRFLLDDMLKWTFTQQQQLQPQKAPFDMVELVEENLSFLELAIKDRQMHLSLEMEEEVHMLADREMIGTCLRNMLQNAIKHGERGTELIVTCREAPGEVELVIRNRGSLQWNTGRSLGLQLMQSFSRMNNCRFTLNEQDGWVVARLTGPVVQAAAVS